jgi:hypothetical protein
VGIVTGSLLCSFCRVEKWLCRVKSVDFNIVVVIENANGIKFKFFLRFLASGFLRFFWGLVVFW